MTRPNQSRILLPVASVLVENHSWARQAIYDVGTVYILSSWAKKGIALNSAVKVDTKGDGTPSLRKVLSMCYSLDFGFVLQELDFSKLTVCSNISIFSLKSSFSKVFICLGFCRRVIVVGCVSLPLNKRSLSNLRFLVAFISAREFSENVVWDPDWSPTTTLVTAIILSKNESGTLRLTFRLAALC